MNFEFQKSSESHGKWSARIDMHLVRHGGGSVQFANFGEKICFSQRWILWPIKTENPRPTEEPESALKCETISWDCRAIWLSCEKVHKNIVMDIVEREHTLSRLLKLSIFMEISSQEKYTKRRWSICMYRDLASDKHPYDNVGSNMNRSRGYCVGSVPGLARFPWMTAWQPTPIFLPRESPWTEEPCIIQSIVSQRVG